jgi:uncharacterized protein
MTSASAVSTATDSSAPGMPTRVEIHETHTGIVILVGDRAYKVKKPILTDFFDFRDPRARELVCAQEVLLNGRLAPDSYLGVAHFAEPGGDVNEPVIVMRRYPADRRLASLVERAEPVEHHLVAIAEILARFHADASRSAVVDADAHPDVLAERWNENMTVLEHYAGSVLVGGEVADVRRLASRYLAGRAALFEARIDDGRIVDGHGDLLSEDVFCMPDRPVILDCLEFDEHLRHVDGLDDAAFLAMDLQYRGRADLATFFLHAYRQLAHDQAPASLAHFYVAYRAVVRAKVDCIRVDQGSASAAADARRHLRLGLDQLRAGTVQLVLIGGGPASGKTTLARELASRIGAVAISTDDVRHELVQSGRLAGEPGAYDAGRYDPQNVTAVYDAVLKRASGLLSNGRSVILDGTWRDPRQRQSAREVAANLHCVTVELACVLGVDQALERIRLRGLDSHSEVTEEIAKTIYQGETTWANANRIDTTAAIDHSVAAAAAVCCSAI